MKVDICRSLVCMGWGPGDRGKQWRRKMISSGVAKKTMRAEIAVSSETA